MKLNSSVAFALLGSAAAQQAAYGQCGGNNWTGATTCVSGYTCTVQSEWYSQCVPGTASAPAPAPAPAPTTTKAVTTSKTTLVTSAAPPATSTSTGGGSGSYVTTSGGKFNIDGSTKYFEGTNCYWCGFLTNNADVDLVFSHLKSSSLKVLRVWGFNDVTSTPGSGTVWYQSFVSGQDPVINTGANGLQRMDYVVSAAEKAGIKLIRTRFTDLAAVWINFVNYWDDYGGMTAYISKYGGSKTTWYTNTAAQTQYKKYISAVVSRYKTSKAIFAWELANEVRCPGCDVSVIYNWAAGISSYIKGLDSNHLVTLGDEGFNPGAGDGSYPYQTGEGVSFSKNLGISTLDFGTYHMYPTSWGVDTGSWAVSWINAHAALCKAAGKPCVFEEYGISSNHVATERPWQKAALAADGNVGDMFWQLGDTLSSGKTSDDGNTIYYGSTDWAELVTAHVAEIVASGK